PRRGEAGGVQSKSPKEIVLAPDQKTIADKIIAAFAEKTPKPILLDGVTGAGKTEVYFEAIAHALHNNKQALILLPEIALSNAFLERFEHRFGFIPALWHSGLTPAQRRKTWRALALGQIPVIIGARSALFLPYPDLGVIVVDEEHDSAFKQEETPIYHARDMAIVRAHLAHIPVVLVSATPSLETMHNAWTGRYAHLHLPDRFGGARLPDIHLIDLKADKPESQHFIAPTLKSALIDTLQTGEQALLFLNRRGYAPLTLCRGCGHRMECPRCTSWLVEHKKSNRLHCHHCGFGQALPKTCPACNAEKSFVPCGPGVERIYEEVSALFPDARTLLLASDTVSGEDDLRDKLRQIKDRQVDIIIGTQIIAKGHHFPALTLVGAVDADLALGGEELRAAERTYQLLYQVAGRAGRAERPGRVYIQTHVPGHPLMQALAHGSREQFLEAESAQRQHARMPPFSRLVGIIIAGRKEAQVIAATRALAQSAPHGHGVETLGPAPAPLARLRGRYRYRFLVRAERQLNIQKTVKAWLENVKIPTSIRVAVDVDPQSFL
ncbi:MAG: primosomal protein N', partial [Alphaproteobacteria bacterium]|nr:primosomal protein N' [Alphaproteobacteria bacterium]